MGCFQLFAVIRDDLNLTKTTISVASIASITGKRLPPLDAQMRPEEPKIL